MIQVLWHKGQKSSQIFRKEMIVKKKVIEQWRGRNLSLDVASHLSISHKWCYTLFILVLCFSDEAQREAERIVFRIVVVPMWETMQECNVTVNLQLLALQYPSESVSTVPSMCQKMITHLAFLKICNIHYGGWAPIESGKDQKGKNAELCV